MPKLTVRLAEPRLYNVKDAAAFFGMSRSWVRERVARGDLDGFLCGNLLVSGQSINRYLATRAVGRQVLEPPVESNHEQPVPAGSAP